MATGDKDDITARIRATLPLAWFGNGSTPILNAVIAGLATAWANFYALYVFVGQQIRISTASGVFLDMASVDFYGNQLPRGNSESDASFRARIRTVLFQPKGTRWAINNALVLITGRVPVIFEPQRPADIGSYSSGGCGYSAGGAYGSMLMPCNALIVAYRKAQSGFPLVSGYGSPQGAYSTPSRSDYATLPASQMAVSDAAIFAAVDSVKLAGTNVWVRISN